MQGLPKSIIKKYGVSKRAWAVFRGRKRHHAHSTVRSVKSTVRHRRRYAYRGRRHHGPRKFTLPMAPIGGLAVGLYQPLSLLAQSRVKDAFGFVAWQYAGIADSYGSPHFDFNGLMHGTIPLLLGVGIHKLATKFGVNRFLAQAGVPIVRV